MRSALAEGHVRAGRLAGLAHITGGGLEENLDRVLPKRVDAVKPNRSSQGSRLGSPAASSTSTATQPAGRSAPLTPAIGQRVANGLALQLLQGTGRGARC